MIKDSALLRRGSWSYGSPEEPRSGDSIASMRPKVGMVFSPHSDFSHVGSDVWRVVVRRPDARPIWSVLCKTA